ncbi:MAG: hypothetical protein K1X29_05615 [Bdellovibrionales bacterium]|nr:hypothetical protein [Bdellovibrionales bacterium]
MNFTFNKKLWAKLRDFFVFICFITVLAHFIQTRKSLNLNAETTLALASKKTSPERQPNSLVSDGLDGQVSLKIEDVMTTKSQKVIKKEIVQILDKTRSVVCYQFEQKFSCTKF